MPDLETPHLHHHFDRLRRLFGGEEAAAPFYLQGRLARGAADPHEDPACWVRECVRDLETVQTLAEPDDQVFRPAVIEYGIYGVRFIDTFFGAKVYLADGNWWGDGVDCGVGNLKMPSWEDHETWKLARRAAETFVAEARPWMLLGMPTLSSALNIALNLHGESFLLALLADADAAQRDLAAINNLIVAMHQWYLNQAPLEQLQPVVAFERTQPPGFGQLCGCSTQLLSPGQYAEFIAPLDAAVLGAWPEGGMIHLCGAHAQHIPAWRAMDALRAVQITDRAADDFPLYFEGLREDQVIYLNPSPAMPARRALEISGGRRLVIVGAPPAP